MRLPSGAQNSVRSVASTLFSWNSRTSTTSPILGFSGCSTRLTNFGVSGAGGGPPGSVGDAFAPFEGGVVLVLGDGGATGASSEQAQVQARTARASETRN